MNIFQFTVLSFFTKKKNLVLILTSVILLVIFFSFNVQMLEKESQEKINTFRAEGAFIEDDPYADLEASLDEFEFDSNDERQLFYNHYLRQIQYFDFVTTNSMKALPIENAFLDEFVQMELIEGTDTASEVTPKYLGYKKAINNKLISNGYPEESTRYGKNASMFTNATIQIVCSMYGIFLLLFIFGSGVSEDVHSKNIKFLVTQPTHRGKYLVSNIFFTFVSSMTLVLIILILSFLIGLLFFGKGNMNYPIFINSPGNAIFLPLWKYWIRLILAFSPVLLYFIISHFLLSILTGNHYLSLFISFIVNNFLYSSFTKLSLDHFDFLNPFIYLNPVTLFVGLDFKEMEYFSSAYSSRPIYLEYKLFLQNTTYFEGKNIPSLLSNSNISIFYCFLSLSFFSLLLFYFTKIVLNHKDV